MKRPHELTIYASERRLPEFDLGEREGRGCRLVQVVVKLELVNCPPPPLVGEEGVTLHGKYTDERLKQFYC